MNRKRVKITVPLDSEEFDRFDAYCQERGFKKSTLIARLIRVMTSSTSLLEWLRRVIGQFRATHWSFKKTNLGGC